MRSSSKGPLVAALLLLAASPAWATIARSQHAVNTGHNVSTLALTITINAGNAVMVGVGYQASVCSISSVSDTGGSSYTKLASGANGADVFGTLSANASTSVTITPSTSCNLIGLTATYTGVQAFGNTNTSSGNGAALSVSITTQDANNWIFAAFTSLSTTAYTANQGTLIDQGVGGTGPGARNSADCENSSASVGNVTCAVTSGSASWVASAVEMRSTTGGGATAPRRLTLLGVG